MNVADQLKESVRLVAEGSSPSIRAFEEAKQIIGPYVKARTPNRYGDFVETLDAFIKGLEDKQIWNTDFQDPYTYNVSRRIEEAYDQIQKLDEYAALRSIMPRDKFADLWSVSVVSANKVLRILEPHKSNAPEMYKFVSAVAKLGPAIKELKTYIVKGRKPAAPNPNAFNKPMAPIEASKAAAGYAKQAIVAFEGELRKNTETRMLGILNKVKAVVNGATAQDRRKALREIKDNELQSIALRVITQSTFEVADNAVETVKKLATQMVDDIILQYTAKMTSKLALVIAKKSSIKNQKLLYARVRNNLIENAMTFEFEDGSKFKIISSVEYSTSSQGNLFLRFPTRFTDVFMADGSKMSTPSEEKMIRDF